jgi:hypothetical protein
VAQTFAVAQSGKIAHTVSVETIEYRLALLSGAAWKVDVFEENTSPNRRAA